MVKVNIVNNKKVLIVDDERMIRDIFRLALSRDGFMVYSAESAEDALKLLNIENIPVIFLDLNLPGMSGMDLCKRIRSGESVAKIYAVTGYAPFLENSDCKEAGFDNFYTKPFSLDIIKKAANEAFYHVNCTTEH